MNTVTALIARMLTLALLAPVAVLSSLAAAAPQQTAPTAREADERLAFWLERQGFDRLLAGLLEERLARETSDLERRDAAEQLAEVVLRRLRGGDLDPDTAAPTVDRLRKLLPGVDADELALELARARHRALERRVEQWRLGHADPKEREGLGQALLELINESDALRQRFETDLRNDDRRLDRSVGLEAEALLETVDRRRALLETARFVQAWTCLEAAWLARSSLTVTGAGESRPRATQALAHFLALLDTGRDEPTPDDVAVDRRAEESYASAILGAAIARALIEGPTEARPWFALLSDLRTAPALRRSTPGWELATLVLLRDFAAARVLLTDLQKLGPVPASWLRLAVVESAADEVLAAVGAIDFVQMALGTLASQEELAEVIALSERLPASALPAGGFVAGYLRGMRGYAAARAMVVGSTERTTAFREAARALQSAARESDASRAPVARASARQLAGWCLVGAGEHGEASAQFEEAADGLPPNRAAESLWLAAEAALRAQLASQGAAALDFEQSRTRIIERLLERYPGSEFATRAEVARIREDSGAGAEALARLRAVPRGSPAWTEALLAAEEVLYRLFRSATEADRARAAMQYLELARSEDAPPGVVRRTWLRRRAEAALVPGVERLDEALAAVLALRARARDGEFEIGDIEREIRVRELQVAAADGRLDEAIVMLREVESGSASSDKSTTGENSALLLRMARRSILRAAQRIDREDARQAIVDIGGALLQDEASTIDEASRRAVTLAMGRAAIAVTDAAPWPRSRTALSALEALREQRPSDLSVVEMIAALAERAELFDQAVEALRLVLAGTGIGEPPWFDAKVAQVRILATIDPVRARKVLDQHRVLVPEWGPEPWGSQLRALDRRVAAASVLPSEEAP